MVEIQDGEGGWVERCCNDCNNRSSIHTRRKAMQMDLDELNGLAEGL